MGSEDQPPLGVGTLWWRVGDGSPPGGRDAVPQGMSAKAQLCTRPILGWLLALVGLVGHRAQALLTQKPELPPQRPPTGCLLPAGPPEGLVQGRDPGLALCG